MKRAYDLLKNKDVETFAQKHFGTFIWKEELYQL